MFRRCRRATGPEADCRAEVGFTSRYTDSSATPRTVRNLCVGLNGSNLDRFLPMPIERDHENWVAESGG